MSLTPSAAAADATTSEAQPGAPAMALIRQLTPIPILLRPAVFRAQLATTGAWQPSASGTASWEKLPATDGIYLLFSWKEFLNIRRRPEHRPTALTISIGMVASF